MWWQQNKICASPLPSFPVPLQSRQKSELRVCRLARSLARRTNAFSGSLPRAPHISERGNEIKGGITERGKKNWFEQTFAVDACCFAGAHIKGPALTQLLRSMGDWTAFRGWLSPNHIKCTYSRPALRSISWIYKGNVSWAVYQPGVVTGFRAEKKGWSNQKGLLWLTLWCHNVRHLICIYLQYVHSFHIVPYSAQLFLAL